MSKLTFVGIKLPSHLVTEAFSDYFFVKHLFKIKPQVFATGKKFKLTIVLIVDCRH